jgi:hypothetical protein
VLRAVFVQRLKEGVGHAQFKEASSPEEGFGRDVRVLNALNVRGSFEVVDDVDLS